MSLPAENVPSVQESKSMFEELPTPAKSSSDKKQYKVIRLRNGLTACLISDTTDPSVAECTEKPTASTPDTGTAEDADKTTTQNDVKLAAAALCIDVGTFSDPEEAPGLAHFLEHMVVGVGMGSEKFPEEKDFMTFIEKEGGCWDAYTKDEVTEFYFECFEHHLYEAMDRFSQFFISPLLRKDSMTRAREAVESEFQLSSANDNCRKHQLLGGLLNDIFDINSFGWGNFVTSQDNITDEQLYEKLHEFRKRHYSAHRITLAVQARLPIDTLESYVIKLFSAIANKGVSGKNFKQHSGCCLDIPHFNKLYYIEPVEDFCQVTLSWVLPSLKQTYKSKPYGFVNNLLGHEGKGSVLSYLKKKFWATSLRAGISTELAASSVCAYFSVDIILTKKGFGHLEEVILAVFSYLNMLKEAGPNERYFKEFQLLHSVSFQFREVGNAVDTVSSLAENMQYYPPEDYLTGSELWFEYNAKEIQMILDYLVADKMNIMVLSELPESFVYEKVEHSFKTKYTEMDIPPKWLKSWMDAEPRPCFELPEPNPFLTSDFSLLAIEDTVSEYPVKILDTDMIELWYKKDQKFKKPTASYYYNIIYPLPMESPESACMNSMFNELVNLFLNEQLYSATLANFSYDIDELEKGLSIEVSGYNEKLPVLIELIGQYLKNFSDKLTEEAFETIKEENVKSFFDAPLPTDLLSDDLCLCILKEKHFSYFDKQAVISGITFEMMKNFSKNVFNNVYVQGLIQGNVSAKVARTTTENLSNLLKCKPLTFKMFPRIVIKEIPQGEYCCRVMCLDKNNSDSTVNNYYQWGPINFKEHAIVELVLLLIEQPLQTKGQLGYVVSGHIRDTYGILGFEITVNTQADKHTVHHIDMQIEAFVNDARKILTQLSEEEFSKTKTNLIKTKQIVDVNLSDELERNWKEISTFRYIFDRHMHEIKTIEELTIEEVRKWFDDHNMYGNQSKFRKISVQIVGQIREFDNKTESEITETDTNEVLGMTNIQAVEVPHKLELLKDDEELEKNKKGKDYFITDIDNFKSCLKSYLDTPEANFKI